MSTMRKVKPEWMYSGTVWIHSGMFRTEMKTFWNSWNSGKPKLPKKSEISTYPECFHSGSKHIHSVAEWIHTVPEYIHSGVTFLIVSLINMTDLDPVREEGAGTVGAGEQLLHVLLPDQAEAVPQALLLWVVRRLVTLVRLLRLLSGIMVTRGEVESEGYLVTRPATCRHGMHFISSQQGQPGHTDGG